MSDPDTVTGTPDNPTPAPTFVEKAKDVLGRVSHAVIAFFEAHPDLESDAAKDLKDIADEAGPLAGHVVSGLVPPSLAEQIDAQIAEVQSKADADAAAIQADAQRRIEALASVKAQA